MKITKLIGLLALSISFSADCVADKKIEANAIAFISQQVEETEAPSLSVAAGHNGKILFSVAIGLANKSKNKQATANTQYRTGSISKVIGTTALMPLIANNKINLKDNINAFLPYLPAHYQPIQLRHILTHTSGIRHYRFGEYGTNIEYPTIEKATEVFREDSLLFKPGEGYTYSTYGINLVQGIIEKVTGLSLANYLDKVLFAPLSMNYTELEIKGNDVSNYAVGYRSFLTDRAVKEINVSNKYIGGGMRTTPTDLVKMVLAINANTIFDRKTKELMLSIPFPKAAPDRALGWRWMEHKGSKAFVHSGAINGFESFLAHFIEEDITIAVMVNQDGYDYTGNTLYKLFDIVKQGLNDRSDLEAVNN